ncbi:MAG: nucleoside hydrolase [Planctomycetales bacterium]|nr:nucleoside hydrolase [Planctomycetales bacterium]
MVRKLIIDADPGIRDALAIVLALLDPELDVIALTATRGNVTAAKATRNLESILEQVDPPKWPRLGSAVKSPDPEPACLTELGTIASLDGKFGLGDVDFTMSELQHRHDSVKLLIDLVRDDPNRITLLTLGPLTNVAAATERAGDFLSKLGSLVCLGGSVSDGGDVSATAEYNIWSDPEAARSVLNSSANKTFVPLDVSNSVTLSLEQYNRLRNPSSRAIEFLQKIVPHAFRAHHQLLGQECLPLREVVAVAAVARPNLFQSQRMVVDVELGGHLCRGMTVVDRRYRPHAIENATVVTEVDGQGVLDYMMNLLQQTQ